MSRHKQMFKHSKQWWRNVAIWTVIIAVLGTLIVAVQTYYTARQSRIVEESIKLTKDEINSKIEQKKARPSIRYYVLDSYATSIIFEPWLKPRTGTLIEEHKKEITQEVWSDLRLVRKPLLLRTPAVDHFVKLDQEKWEAIENLPRELHKGEDLIDILSKNLFWAKIILSNKIEKGTSSYAENESIKVGEPLSLDLHNNGKNYPLIYISNTAGCRLGVNDIIYPGKYALVADISNEGNAPLKDLVIHGQFLESDPYKLFLLGGSISEGIRWNRSLPFSLDPGEHIMLYLSTIFSQHKTWRTPSEPWFVIGPLVSIDRWQYFDIESSTTENTFVRQFNINKMVTVSGNIFLGSCPYIVFLNSAGEKLKEKRFLINAIGPEKRRKEVISIPAETSKIIIEERDPEVSFIESIGLYSGSLSESGITQNFGSIKLHQGDTYNIPINIGDSWVVIKGYYVPR